MSSIKLELEASVRQDQGKGASRRLRRSNQVPAILYGADQPATALVLDHNKVVTALSHEAFYTHILNLKVNGTAEKVVLKDIHRDPASPRIMHMDFLRISPNQKLHMHIPLHFINEEKAPGVKDGGVVAHNLSDVEVTCLPADLPEFIEVDLSKLKLDQTLHLSGLKLPKGVELAAFSHGVEGHDLPVASIHKPREMDEQTPEQPTDENSASA